MSVDLFFSSPEKDRFAAWQEEPLDSSLLGRASSGLFEWLAGRLHDSVAPSVITLAGSFALVQAWYCCELYARTQPGAASFIAAASAVVFWVTRGLDSRHAARTLNDTALNRLFAYVGDLVAAVFLTNIVCGALLEFTFEQQWFCVQTVQLVFLYKHYSAFLRGDGLRFTLVGLGECLAAAAALLAVRGAYGPGRLQAALDYAEGFYGGALDSRTVCVTAFSVLCVRVALSEPARVWSRGALRLVLALRALSALLRLGLLRGGPVTKDEVIADGLFMSVVTCDVIVAKMAGRELHTYVVLMAGMAVVPSLTKLKLLFVAFYFAGVLWELSRHMDVPLLQVCRNVYCDGIYDLCHIGHKNVFRNAASLGNRLFVGVVGDHDANNYKRPPIMSAAEREAEVRNCKCVTKVLSNAPCFGLTLDYIKKHRIHIVAFGQEYLDRFPDPEDDPYYKVPRQLGIARPMPRTEGLSTSDLIRRIQSRGADSKKSPT